MRSESSIAYIHSPTGNRPIWSGSPFFCALLPRPKHIQRTSNATHPFPHFLRLIPGPSLLKLPLRPGSENIEPRIPLGYLPLFHTIPITHNPYSHDRNKQPGSLSQQNCPPGCPNLAACPNCLSLLASTEYLPVSGIRPCITEFYLGVLFYRLLRTVF